MCADHESSTGRADGDCPCRTGGSGRWIRQGNRIVVVLAGDRTARLDAMRREAELSDEELELDAGEEVEGEFGRRYARAGRGGFRASAVRGGRFGSRGRGGPSRGRRRPRPPWPRRRRWPASSRTILLDPSLIDGDEGSENVRWIQSTLNQVLGEQLPVDGIMTPETRRALRAFQRRHGIPADGIVGPETERALIAARGGRAASARR